MFQNQTLERSEMPYLNQQALPTHPVGTTTGGKMSRSEKKALKQARKNGTLIGGNYIAPVAPREELFMGHPTINEVQQPGIATGYGIPENGRAGSPQGFGGSGSPYNSTYNATSLGSQFPAGQTYQTQSENICYDSHCT